MDPTTIKLLTFTQLNENWRTIVVESIRSKENFTELLDSLDESNRKTILLSTSIKNGKTIAHYLAKYSTATLFTELLEKNREEITKLLEFRDIYGDLPIHYIVKNNEPINEVVGLMNKIIELFPTHIIEKNGRKHQTLLQLAAANGKKNLYNYLAKGSTN